MTRLFIFMLGLFSYSSHVNAQKDLGAWAMFFGDATIKNSDFKINYEIQHRNYNIYSDLNQLLLRGNIQYNGIENLNLALGYAFIVSEKEGKNDSPFYENRIFQDAVTKQFFGKITVRHRLRFEQRFIDNQEFRTRLRYQLKFIVPIFQGEKANSFYGTAYNEIFINTNKTQTVQNVFDRNRVSAGFGYRFNKSLAIQSAYMTQLFEKGNDKQITLGIYHSI